MWRRLFTLPPLLIVAAMLAVVVTSQGVLTAGLLTGAGELPDLTGACQTENPFLVSTCYRGILRSESSQEFSEAAPSVVVFNETQNDLPHYQLADFRQVGTIWGLAFSQREKAVYAGSYQKRQLPFGKDGPGAIYRIDLKTGAVTTFAKLSAGPDQHPPARISKTADDLTHSWVGKSGLGDVDIDEADEFLFVTNLFDRKIYVYDLAAAQSKWSFDHGAAAEPWAADARPFGLEVHGGYLYHAVVNSAESSQDRAELGVMVYRSQFDGSGMQLVARVPLNLARGSMHIGPIRTLANLTWRPWREEYARDRTTPFVYNFYPMPMATDIEIDDAGNMTLALRDRLADLTLEQTTYYPNRPNDEALGIGVGDLLMGRWNGATQRFDFDLTKPYWQTNLEFIGDRSAMGGLAYISPLLAGVPFSQMAAGSLGTQPKLQVETPREGVVYYNGDGSKIGDRYDTGWRREEVCAAEVSFHPFAMAPRRVLSPRPAFAHNGEIPIDGTVAAPGVTPVPRTVRGPGTTGDLELLCKAAAPTPTPAPPTGTPAGATPTSQPIATDTPTTVPTSAPTNTPTSTSTPTPTPNRPLFPFVNK